MEKNMFGVWNMIRSVGGSMRQNILWSKKGVLAEIVWEPLEALYCILNTLLY